jgi:hypothetical protein
LTGRADLLNQSVREIRNALSGKGKFRINRKIRYKVRVLKEDHGFTGDEILSAVFDEFLSKGIYVKCHPGKTLSTFFVHFVNYTLNVLIRHQINEKNRFPRVSLDAIANETPDNDWCSSTGFLENASQDLLADELTPEDHVIAKELQDLISNHFGEDDTAVLFGHRNHQSEANRLEITEMAYRKRLQRKTGSFKDVLEEAGYISSQQ